MVVDHAPVRSSGAQVADDAAGSGRAVPERGSARLNRILEDEVRRRLRVGFSHHPEFQDKILTDDMLIELVRADDAFRL